MSAAVALPIPAFPPKRFGAKRHSKAFGLLEVILVFAIIIGAAAAVFMVYGYAQSSSDAEALTTETNLVAANLRASPYGMAHNYNTFPGGFTTTWMPGIFPDSWNQNGQATEPVLGQAVGIGPGYSPQQFSITINFIQQSEAECQKLGSDLAAAGYDDVAWASAGPMATGCSIFQTTSGCGQPPTTHIIDQSKLASFCGGSAGNLGGGAATPGQSGFTVYGH
jgi:type II secretory pathway pseudopilin PulG